MKPIEVQVASISLSANGIATAQDQTTSRAVVANITASFATGQVLAPNGSLAVGGIVTLAKASVLTLTSGSDFSGTTFTIDGDSAGGRPIREVITGPNNTTVAGVVPFKTIRSITPSLGSTNDFTVGAYPTELTLLAFPTTLTTPRPVTLASAADLHLLTFTVVGTARNGAPLSEAITGPNNSTVTTTKLFATVTGITYTGTLSSNITAGWGTTAVSRPIPVDHYRNPFGIGIGVELVTGAPTYTVEHTFDRIQDPAFEEGNAEWLPHASLVSQTVAADGNYAFPVSAIRLRVEDTGTAKMRLLQAGR